MRSDDVARRGAWVVLGGVHLLNQTAPRRPDDPIVLVRVAPQEVCIPSTTVVIRWDALGECPVNTLSLDGTRRGAARIEGDSLFPDASARLGERAHLLLQAQLPARRSHRQPGTGSITPHCLRATPCGRRGRPALRKTLIRLRDENSEADDDASETPLFDHPGEDSLELSDLLTGRSMARRLPSLAAASAPPNDASTPAET